MPTQPSPSSWWSEIARGFCGPQLDDLESVVLPLVGEDVALLLRPELQARYVYVIGQVGRLDWTTDVTTAADTAFGLLIDAVPAADDDGDVPFALVLGRIESPRVASSFAHRWWTHMARAHVDDTPRSGVAFIVAAYAVAACEGLLHVHGERHERDVLLWLQVAARHIEVEHGNGIDLVLVLRAARLLQPVLQRASAALPRT